MDEAKKILCYACGKEVEIASEGKVYRGDECSYCSVSLRCCKMCKFYDTSAYNECREPSAERVLEKEKANYCDYYVIFDGKMESGEKESNKLKNVADSLFKK